MTAFTLADRIDVTSIDQLAALYRQFELSRESLQSVAEALEPARQDVQFYVMR